MCASIMMKRLLGKLFSVAIFNQHHLCHENFKADVEERGVEDRRQDFADTPCWREPHRMPQFLTAVFCAIMDCFTGIRMRQ
jgi:hypothetical protein